ncbi:hypothetical protein GCK72_017387 [Caenorhabditis remanei]|uniref:RING-type domain-containing protein n=1 Tax=Caenorhabditis remanei TaxID=31234 RepID=A0A6A5G7K9_CAERE|nr:hypothetical protein GCK72_017387 [Caenorhabditis remanei]KAF1750836.1 hypothetical protein GCK72_017387 [Caenorhabditis remanei]
MDLYPLVFFQIVYTTLHITILSDYWIVWILESNRGHQEEDDLDTTVDTEEIIDSSDDEDLKYNDCFDQDKNDLRYHDLKCSVCQSFYHESIEKRTPNLLSCGHTVCSGCAKMLYKIDFNVCISCPICREKTDIDYNYDELKKNYALLGIIQEMKQDKKTWSFVIILFTLRYFNIWFSLYPLVCLQIVYTSLHITILSDVVIVWILESNRGHQEEDDLDTTVVTVEIIDSSDDEDLEDKDCFDQKKSDLRYHDLKCSVCQSFYHESIEKRTPKLLSCGHTVGSGCAKMLYKKDFNICIPCPICREKTKIDYVELKKNYALLGVIQEMKQDKKTVQRRHSLS